MIRIPSLIGHALYLTGIYRILKISLRKRLFVFGFICLIFNPFMLELFSAARGYGLGLGFLSHGLYYCLCAIDRSNPGYKKSVKIGFMFLAFSVFSNFSFLHVYLSVFILFGLQEFACSAALLKKGKSFGLFLQNIFKEIIASTGMSLAFLVATCMMPIMSILRTREYYSGGMDGFWANTVASLVRATLYGKSYAEALFAFPFNALIISLLLGAAIIIGHKYFHEHKFHPNDKRLIGIILLLLLCPALISFQYKVFGTKYVQGRTAIYFVPIFLIFMLMMWEHINEMNIKFFEISMNSFVFVLTLLSLIHWMQCINFDRFYVCPYAGSVKSAVQYIAHAHKNHHQEDGSVLVGTHWIFAPIVDFYRVKDKLIWMKQVSWKVPRERCDYYYLLSPESPESERWIRQYALEGDFVAANKYNIKTIKNFVSFHPI